MTCGRVKCLIKLGEDDVKLFKITLVIEGLSLTSKILVTFNELGLHLACKRKISLTIVYVSGNL
jgi:hypothetical protein